MIHTQVFENNFLIYLFLSLLDSISVKIKVTPSDKKDLQSGIYVIHV